MTDEDANLETFGERDLPDSDSSVTIAIVTLRAVFFLCAVGIAAYLTQDSAGDTQYLAMLAAIAISLGVIALDSLAIARSSIGTVSAVVFGLLIGFLAAQLFTGIVTLMGDFEASEESKQAARAIRLILTLLFCYLGPSYILRTKDDFRFIVPYVEFQRQAKGPSALVLDSSALIDGRIVDLARTPLFDAPFLVPRFVVEELQHLADQRHRQTREKGRRGLDRLKDLQETAGVELRVVQARYATGEVDRKLIDVAQAQGGKVVTTDFNLQKVAEVEGVAVLNLNELATAVRLQFVPGDTLSLMIVRPGEGAQQGVGYLEDGTMVVVEGARDKKGKRVQARVTSSIQSSAGRMVFARFDAAAPVIDPSDAGPSSGSGTHPTIEPGEVDVPANAKPESAPPVPSEGSR